MKVAKLAETLNLGVSSRVSKNLKLGSWFPSGVYVLVNLLFTGTGGIFPVIISYAPESPPVGGLLKSPVRRTGPLDMAASYLPLIRSIDVPYLRCSSETWSRWVLRTVNGLGQAWRRKRAAVQIRLHPAPG